jgi:hypothetical protein
VRDRAGEPVDDLLDALDPIFASLCAASSAEQIGAMIVTTSSNDSGPRA